MNYTVTQLDRRYAYWKEFNYMIEFHRNPDWAVGATTGTGVLAFDRVRKWMNESWGWSQDVETRKDIIQVHSVAKTETVEVNPHWAWSCRYQEYRIYVNDPALTMFKLKWSNDSNTG